MTREHDRVQSEKTGHLMECTRENGKWI